jgi:Na+:H+ antiporter, NhaA family
MAEPAHRPPPPLFRAVVLDPLQAFARLEASGGIVLFAAALVAFALANSPWAPAFLGLWETPVAVSVGGRGFHADLRAVVDDGLMALFFLVVGMEIKRELLEGELRSLRQALLPGIAALGGMAVPGLIYLAFNHGTEGAVGWAIPTATDIAFSIGCLILLGKRVSRGLLVFLTALAIFDDIGGILIIALFYGQGVNPEGLLWLAVAVLAVFSLNRLGVENGAAYGLGGIGLWLAFHRAGLHPTLAGVLLGLLVPAVTRRPVREVLDEVREDARASLATGERPGASDVLRVRSGLGEAVPPLERFVEALHPWVIFGVLPLFALANSGVSLAGMSARSLLAPIFLGTALGLFLGKQVGILGFTRAAVAAGLATTPGGARWGQVHGVSVVAGIGFTVALFIANLAFARVPHLLNEARLGVLVGSLVSGVVGTLVLRAMPLPAERTASP